MQIQIVLISNDYEYSLGVLNELSKMNHEIVVREMDWIEVSDTSPEEFVAARDDRWSTIVIFDFGFVRRACDEFIQNLVALRQDTSLECLALRLPADENFRRRLTNWDVPVFDMAHMRMPAAQVVH